MTHKPFSSHQWNDKNIVTDIVHGLIEDGMKPILDEWKFVPGDSLRKSMSDGINNSTSFVLFWSENAAKSANVEFERELGLNELKKRTGYRIICVLLDNAPPPVEHSYRLYIDWRKGKRKSKLFNKNLHSLVRAISGLSPVESHESSSSALVAYNKAKELLEEYKKDLLLYDKIYYSLEELQSVFSQGFTALADVQLLLGYHFEWRKKPGEKLILLASNDGAEFVEICSLRVPDVWNGTGRWQLHDPIKSNNEDKNEDKLIALYLASPNLKDKPLSLNNDSPSFFISAIHLSSFNARRFYELARKNFENIE